MPPDVRPAVPEGLLPVEGGGVVAVLVLPLILIRVRQPPVQLHHHAIVAVEAVPASPPAVRPGERRLPDRLRQPVRPFHVPVVAELQQRMVATGRGHDEFTHVSAPTQSGALAHCGAQPLLVSEVTRERTRHPPAHVIKVRRSLYQIEHGLLHRGPRRIAIYEHGLDRPSGAMKADPESSHDMTLTGNCDMDWISRLVGKPQQFGCRLVAEHRAWTRREDRSPQLRTAARHSSEGRVDTPVKLLPPAASDPESDHVCGQFALKRLSARDNTGLGPGDIAECRRELTFHTAQCEGQH
jgi:hypothetical protein